MLACGDPLVVRSDQVVYGQDSCSQGGCFVLKHPLENSDMTTVDSSVFLTNPGATFHQIRQERAG